MIVPGSFLALGKLVRKSRLDQGYSRRWLVRRIVERRTLEVTTHGAMFMIRELEVDGLAMNVAVVERIIDVLGITDSADLFAQAKAAAAAEFTAQLKGFSRRMAIDRDCPEQEVFDGLVRVVETQHGRPLV
jgi:hypothetical protein